MNYEHEVFPTTRGVCAYISDLGYLVIEQEQEDHQEVDQTILIPPNQIETFISAIQAAVKGA